MLFTNILDSLTAPCLVYKRPCMQYTASVAGTVHTLAGAADAWFIQTPTNTRFVLYIKAGAASMASAWFIHWPVRPVWPVRGLYGPVPIGNYSAISLLTRCCGRALSHWWSLVFQHNLHTKSIQQSSFSRPIRLHFISPQSFVRNCLFIIYIFIA